MYRDHRKGPRGPPGGATCPGGHMGCRGCALAYMGQGHQPQEAHAPRKLGEGRVLKGEGTSEVPWGGGTPPSRTLPWRKGQGCASPLALAPIYMWGVGGQPNQCSGGALPLSQVLLLSRGAWRSPAGLPRSSTTTTPLCCCWMESSSTSPSLLAGSRHGRRHRAVRVLKAEVPSVRHLVIGDLDHDEYDSINPVHLNASA